MKRIVLFSILLFALMVASAQDSKKETRKARKAAREAQKVETINRLVEEENYVFRATQALPSGMRSVKLNSTYELRVDGDQLDCYLPYFGRAYSAPYSSTKGPMTFKGTLENYTEESTKDGYIIKFTFKKEDNDNLSFILNIGKTGYSTLSVNSNNRQSISYYGDLVAPED